MRDMPDRPNILEHDPYQWAYPVADRILAIMAQELRKAFVAGWVASFKEAELSSVWIKQAQADALRRWPDKEE